VGIGRVELLLPLLLLFRERPSLLFVVVVVDIAVDDRGRGTAFMLLWLLLRDLEFLESFDDEILNDTAAAAARLPSHPPVNEAAEPAMPLLLLPPKSILLLLLL
jgi:hypothetical protein